MLLLTLLQWEISFCLARLNGLTFISVKVLNFWTALCLYLESADVTLVQHIDSSLNKFIDPLNNFHDVVLACNGNKRTASADCLQLK